MLRDEVESRGSPQRISQPVWRRFRAEPDYAMCLLPLCNTPWPLSGINLDVCDFCTYGSLTTPRLRVIRFLASIMTTDCF
jgi:hypothetical protein